MDFLHSARGRYLAAAGIALLVANVTLLSPAPLILRMVAALCLTLALPGTLLVTVLRDARAAPSDPLEHVIEHTVLAAGAGFGATIILLLALSYLPGGLTFGLTLLTFDGVVVALMTLAALTNDSSRSGRLRRQRPTTNDQPRTTAHRSSFVVRRSSSIGLLALVLVGGFLRFANLGYAEFQGDEARAVLRAAAILQGYEDVLFLHRKGPTEILIPTALYALTGKMTEMLARAPFALANVAGLLALLLLGWRLFGVLAGWSAAMLLALDGYFIAFARIVQYQSVVFLTSVLVVLVLHRLTRQPYALRRSLLLAALLWSAGLLSHYEAVMVIFPALYLLWRVGRSGVGWGRLVRGMLPAIGLGGLILAAFYVPFALHPNFGDTLRYLGEGRIGGQWPYNNLADFWRRTTLYSTTYYLALLVGLGALALIGIYWRGLQGIARRLVVAFFVAGLALTVWRSDWLTIGGVDFAFAFFGAALLVAWFMPHILPEERTLLLWLGGPLLLALFFTADPRTHVYTFFMPWVLLCGSVIERGWGWLARSVGMRIATGVGITTAAVSVLLFGTYAYWYFISTSEVLRTWDQDRPGGFPVTYALPSEEGLFGFPLQNGWKAIGALYAEGALSGAYLTNAKPHVVNWYTRSIHECVRDHRYFFFVEDVNLHERGQRQTLRRSLQEEYALLGAVLVNGKQRMEIYERHGASSADPGPVQHVPFAPHARTFDAELSGPVFPIAAPVVEPAVEPTVENRLDYRFGNAIRLVGYDVSRSVAPPGQTVELTLYWQTAAPIATDYSVFNQIVDRETNRMQGQRDGQPGCDGQPTSGWQPGELIVDAYSIPVFADATPGEYPLLVGMYERDSGDRLPIVNENDEFVGDALPLTQITIAPRPSEETP